MKTLLFRLALVGYLLTIVYHGLRPFKPIPGRTYPVVAPSTNGVVCTGAALEDPAGSRLLWDNLTLTGQMSLEALLKTDSLQQSGPARIISFSFHSMSRNFTLGQEWDGLSFRLRTSETDNNGMYPSLTAPDVFKNEEFKHVVVTYDGHWVRLYVDGVRHSETIELHGDFSSWSKNHLFTVGDEPCGVRPWAGQIAHFSIYDRALGQHEVELLQKGERISEAVYSFPSPHSMRPLRYRNLFAYVESSFNKSDCIANILGFVPLASLLWLACTGRFRKMKRAVWMPLLVGLALSGTFEFFQRGILGRVPCLVDLAYNMLGTLLGCLLLWLGLKHRRLCAML